MVAPLVSYMSQVVFEPGIPGAFVYAPDGTFIPLITQALGLEFATRYVGKGGNDATGDGSLGAPFLTVAAALASITDASSAKPYQVRVGPGTYSTAFTLKAWVGVVGAGQQLTTISQVNANWVDASFAAGSQEASLSNLAIAANAIFDFSLVSAAGAAYIRLNNLSFRSGSLLIKGNAAANGYSIQNCMVDGLVNFPITLTNIGNGFIEGIFGLISAITIQSTDAYTTIHRIGGMETAGIITVAWTGAVTANPLLVLWCSAGQGFAGSNAIVVSGAGAQLTNYQAIISAVLADVNQTLSFGNVPNAAGAIIGVIGAFHDYIMTPTAARVITIEQGGNTETRLRIRNLGAFPITVTGSGANLFGPTWIMPRGQYEATYNQPTTKWNASPQSQAGSVVLVSGVSPFIPADVSSTSRMTAIPTLWTNTAFGWITALGVDKVVGTRAGGGGFKLTAVDNNGNVQSADFSTYDWTVE